MYNIHTILYNVNIAFSSHNNILGALQMMALKLTLYTFDDKAPRHKMTTSGFRVLNFACSVQKSKQNVTIWVSDYCRALDWWFAYCVSAPKPPFCDLLRDAGAEILWTVFPRLPVGPLLLGSLMEGRGKKEGASVLFSCNNSPASGSLKTLSTSGTHTSYGMK